MADEEHDHEPPPPIQSAGPSDNINIAINPNTRNQQKKT